MAKKFTVLCSAVKVNTPKKCQEAIRNLSIIALSLLGAVFLSETIYRYLAMAQNVILIYVLAILIISVFTSYSYSVVGTLAAVILYDYMITAPRLGFSVTMGFPITMIIMLIVSLTTCTLVAKIKTIAVEAVEAKRKTETVYRLIRNFINASDQESLVRIAGQEVLEQLHRTAFFYLGNPGLEDVKTWAAQAGPGTDLTLFTDPAQREAAAMVYRGCGADTLFQSQAELSYWRLGTEDAPLGVMCIAQGSAPLKKDEELLRMIVVQMSIILEKLNIAEHRQKAEMRAEREQTRSSFLRGVSHDLRSPLTSILGASSMLMDSTAALHGPAALELLDGIHADADWLLRMVENILTITRLQSENMKVSKKLEAPEELVAYAVNTIRKRYQSRRISIAAPQELVLVPMDPILITQVLINLLENAHRHSPAHSEISVTLTIHPHDVCIAVKDRGAGLPSGEGRDLFEIDPRQGGVSPDSSRGMGMGLSICKTIVTAHGGEIGARNNLRNGACFWFTLPLQP